MRGFRSVTLMSTEGVLGEGVPSRIFGLGEKKKFRSVLWIFVDEIERGRKDTSLTGTSLIDWTE